MTIKVLFFILFSFNAFSQKIYDQCKGLNNCSACSEVQEEMNEIQLQASYAKKCKIPYLKLSPISHNGHTLYEILKCDPDDNCQPIYYTTNPKKFQEPYLSNKLRDNIRRAFQSPICKSTKEKKPKYCSYYTNYINGFKIVSHNLKSQSVMTSSNKLVNEHVLRVNYRLLSTPANVGLGLSRYLVQNLNFKLETRRRDKFKSSISTLLSSETAEEKIARKKYRQTVNFCMFRRNIKRVKNLWTDQSYRFSYLGKDNQLCAKPFLGQIDSPSLQRRMIGEETLLLHTIHQDLTSVGSALTKQYVKSTIKEAHEILEEE